MAQAGVKSEEIQMSPIHLSSICASFQLERASSQSELGVALPQFGAEPAYPGSEDAASRQTEAPCNQRERSLPVLSEEYQQKDLILCSKFFLVVVIISFMIIFTGLAHANVETGDWDSRWLGLWYSFLVMASVSGLYYCRRLIVDYAVIIIIIIFRLIVDYALNFIITFVIVASLLLILHYAWFSNIEQ